ncbi:putative aldo-keto reductase 1 [Senna tora]|uniref:Putative aldo-keto reductase 1 n=1 Tax=Senna tora TaxID=362788 RepID=A0A834THG7_9FABA|nr:putative aldo-keto reductase 1 [Senna tora]
MAALHIPRVRLGTQGFEVSKLGFGCMGLTGSYGDPVADEVGISVIKHAFSKGITFFDTADLYGANNANEILVGKALKEVPREKVQVATKFGIIANNGNFTDIQVKGSPEYVRSCCEASLKRLDVEYIDLYYQHRVDKSVPIEDTVSEFSFYMCPLGRGFFGGKVVVETLPANSSLKSYPRFQAENLEKNKNIYNRIESIGKKHECSAAQLALAWVLHQGNDVVPIPGE